MVFLFELYLFARIHFRRQLDLFLLINLIHRGSQITCLFHALGFISPVYCVAIIIPIITFLFKQAGSRILY